MKQKASLFTNYEIEELNHIHLAKMKGSRIAMKHCPKCNSILSFRALINFFHEYDMDNGKDCYYLDIDYECKKCFETVFKRISNTCKTI